MGSVKQALCGNDLFYSVGVLLSDGVIGEFFLFPPNPFAVGGALRGAQRLSVDQWFFFLERFLFVLPGEYCFLPRATCYPPALSKKSHASTMTYSGREEERAPSIYRAGSCRPGALARVRRSKAF